MVSKHKIFFMSISFLLVLSLVLSACTKSSKDNTGSSVQQTQQQGGNSNSSTPEKKQPVTLEMSWWGDDVRHQAIMESLKLFEKKYDWIKVKPTYQGWDGYHDKLTVQLSTRKAPDLFMFTTNNVQEYGRNGLLVDYNNHKSELPFIPSIDSIMKRYLVDGKMFGLPTGVNTGVLIYDKKIFDDTKVPYPTDNESWMSLGEKLIKVHEANPKVYGNAGDWLSNFDQYQLMLKQLGFDSVVDGNPPTMNMAPEASAKILTWTEQLWAKGTVPRDVTDTIGLQAQNVATLNGASSSIPGTVAKTKDPLGFATVPKTFDGTGKKITGPPGVSSMWGIPVSSKNQKEAMMLVNFLLTDHDSLKAMKLAIGAPGVPDSLNYVAKEVVGEGSVEQQMLDAVKRSQQGADEFYFSPQPPGLTAAVDAFKVSIESYIFKKINKEKFIEEAQKGINNAFIKAGK